MSNSGQLWGGRFTEEPNEVFTKFNESFSFDRRLFAADITASIAHAGGFRRAAVLTEDEFRSIRDGLSEMLREYDQAGDAYFEAASEDVHSFIEARLIAKIGDAGRKLHTGRSRNDQVATAFRLWLRGEIDTLGAYITDAQRSLIAFAERHSEAVIPGYTHLQRAQPVMFAHWCLAYFEMLERDAARLADARKRVNVMPLGSGALAGTGFPIDREAVARDLGFEAISPNSLDAVSDRDFAVEFAAAAALMMVHLSRLAEDMILYCSSEFGFMTLSDAVSSGSSLMPQKKNPDALELLRGKSGRVFGSLVGLLTIMKGLPLAYNKDMQEDKEAVFDIVDTAAISLRAAATVIDNASLNEDAALAAATTGYLNATELADYLVKKGVPFRTAHAAVGKAVLFAISKGVELGGLSLEELRQFSDAVEKSVFDELLPDATLASKSAVGGTSPSNVKAALTAARKRVGK
ncbi:MAG: argininosuccinate lyase [Chloracidobacterium sp.]|nr:argininosuccinate lyase [Chloracidobacterium sp.]MCO5334232.1 argininosuccinate lyase [Pyrinomonadaceae bacterium]